MDRKLLRALHNTLLVWTNPLAAGRKVSAVRAFWRTQMIRRGGRSFSIEIGDTKLTCPPWSAMGTIVAATGAHEPTEQMFLEAFIRSGDGVIDVGANIGFYAIPLAKLGAWVSAFEPSEQARGFLNDNIEINGLEGRVRVFDQAVGDFDGIARFTEGLDAENHLLVDDSANEEGVVTHEIQVATMATMFGTNEEWFASHEVVFLKIDAEGHDEEVIRGSTPLLKELRPVLMVETRMGGHEIRSLLASFGYSVHWYDHRTRTLVGFPQGWGGNYQFHTNFIAVPNERLDWVLDRLEAAPKIKPIPPKVRPI